MDTSLLRQDYCSCLDAYKERGRVDPQCESCQTSEWRHAAAEEIDSLRKEVKKLKTTKQDLYFPTMPSTWDKYENVDRQGGSFSLSEIDEMGKW